MLLGSSSVLNAIHLIHEQTNKAHRQNCRAFGITMIRHLLISSVFYPISAERMGGVCKEQSYTKCPRLPVMELICTPNTGHPVLGVFL